jgi:peptidoglycan/xylan/chitin deacetylase (PgdA/CDA1 family)
VLYRRRRLVALAAAVALISFAWGAVSGAPDEGHPKRAHAPPRAQSVYRPNAIDRALRYTGYVKRGSRRRREVALTFDDGPSRYTPRLLRALRRVHAPATFFPIGYAITGYPRQFMLLRRSGHPIGDHSMNHPLLPEFPASRQAAEIDGQARLLKRSHLPYPHLFRPPYGGFDATTRALLRERRMLMVLWSVNPEDYYRPGTKVIVKRVLGGVRPGAIVLLHDGGGDRSQTVAALPVIIHALRERGLHLVTVNRLLGLRDHVAGDRAAGGAGT